MVAVGKLFCFRCWSVRTQATCRPVVLKRPLGGTLLLEQWINFSPHEAHSTVRFSPNMHMVWWSYVCLPPKEYGADVKGGGRGEARASERRTDVLCCSGDLRSVWSDWGKWPLMLSLLELIQMTLGNSFWPGSHKDVLLCVCASVCVCICICLAVS